MISLYCPRRSNGARMLLAALNVERPGIARQVWTRTLPDDDFVIAWGSPCPGALNAQAGRYNKIQELSLLRQAVTVPAVSLTPVAGWFGRLRRHHGANDLLMNNARGPTRPDYWVEPRPCAREFRLHVFRDQVFRVGIKLPARERPHPMFHTRNGGWNIMTSHDATNQTLTAARLAVAALGYDFGAVDVGVDENNRPAVVYEVNSAPGMDTYTARRYAKQILQIYPEAP